MRWKGAVLQCSSMAWKPASIAERTGPIAISVDRPIAESIVKRPPTQSQNSNMFAVSMRNLLTSSALSRIATKCRRSLTRRGGR